MGSGANLVAASGVSARGVPRVNARLRVPRRRPHLRLHATPTPTPTTIPTSTSTGRCSGAANTPGGPDPWGGLLARSRQHRCAARNCPDVLYWFLYNFS